MESCSGKDGERPFKCDKCDKSYTNSYNLKYYMECRAGITVTNTAHSKEFIEEVVQLAQEFSVKNSSKVFKIPYSQVVEIK